MQNNLFLPVFEPYFLNHVVFCLIFLDLLRNTFPLQKCSHDLFISSIRSSSFHLFSLFVSPLVFVVSFTCFFFFLKLPFFVFSLSLFLYAKHCAKKIYLLRLQQNSLCLSSLFHQKNYVFSVSFFVEPFLH